jgi:RHS repeat-associated protein
MNKLTKARPRVAKKLSNSSVKRKNHWQIGTVLSLAILTCLAAGAADILQGHINIIQKSNNNFSKANSSDDLSNNKSLSNLLTPATTNLVQRYGSPAGIPFIAAQINEAGRSSSVYNGAEEGSAEIEMLEHSQSPYSLTRFTSPIPNPASISRMDMYTFGTYPQPRGVNIQAQNQFLAEEATRERMGPIIVPQLQRNNSIATDTTLGGMSQISSSPYISDRQGSIREMTNAAGVIQAQYSYDAYGRLLKTQGSLNADFEYCGYYYHIPSGLSLTPNRAYSSYFGRWISRDPLGETMGANLYAYVGNSPIMYADPSGLGPVNAVTWGATGATIGYYLGGGGGLIATAPEGGIGAWPGAGVGAGIGGGLGGGLGWLYPDPDWHWRNPDWYKHKPTPCYAKPPRDAKDPNGAKAPGKPTDEPRFKDPKDGENWAKSPNGGWGWQAEDGSIWVPTGQGGEAHGGPHWDVQYPDGSYGNAWPGGRYRPGNR